MPKSYMVKVNAPDLFSVPTYVKLDPAGRATIAKDMTIFSNEATAERSINGILKNNHLMLERKDFTIEELV